MREPPLSLGKQVELYRRQMHRFGQQTNIKKTKMGRVTILFRGAVPHEAHEICVPTPCQEKQTRRSRRAPHAMSVHVAERHMEQRLAIVDADRRVRAAAGAAAEMSTARGLASRQHGSAGHAYYNLGLPRSSSAGSFMRFYVRAARASILSALSPAPVPLSAVALSTSIHVAMWAYPCVHGRPPRLAHLDALQRSTCGSACTHSRYPHSLLMTPLLAGLQRRAHQ